MTSLKLVINEKSGKGKYLIAFIKELAKSDRDIRIESVNEPNPVTRKAMKDAESGNVTMITNIDDFFENI